MSCDTKNKGLCLGFNLHRCIQFLNLSGRFITIHKRHVAIHQDQLIFIWVVIMNRQLDSAQSFFSVKGKFSYFLPVFDSEYHEKAIDNITVELFIIDNQDLPSIKSWSSEWWNPFGIYLNRKMWVTWLFNWDYFVVIRAAFLLNTIKLDGGDL